MDAADCVFCPWHRANHVQHVLRLAVLFLLKVTLLFTPMFRTAGRRWVRWHPVRSVLYLVFQLAHSITHNSSGKNHATVPAVYQTPAASLQKPQVSREKWKNMFVKYFRNDLRSLCLWTPVSNLLSIFWSFHNRLSEFSFYFSITVYYHHCREFYSHHHVT